MSDLAQLSGLIIDVDSIVLERAFRNYDKALRVASPAIITKYNPMTQTVSAVITIKEATIQKDGTYLQEEISEIPDIPIIMPRAGGYAITFPIKIGDECLLIFSDTIIDEWFMDGAKGTTAKNIARDKIIGTGFNRRHDLSDAFAILGPWSQPERVGWEKGAQVGTPYSEDAMEIRNNDGTKVISISEDAIKIAIGEDTTYLEVTDSGITLETDGTLSIKSTGTMNIESSGTVNVKGNSIVLAEGTQGIARLGDEVSVNASTHIGKITGASSKVKAG